jgi:hypothetical protein
MSFTKDSFPVIRNDINAALAEVGRKYGMQLSIDRITFTDTTFRTTVNAVLNTATTTPTASAESANEIKWKAQFLAHPSRFGMFATDFGRTIKVRGQMMTIVGARPKANADIVLKKTGTSVGAFVAYPHNVIVQALKEA